MVPVVETNSVLTLSVTAATGAVASILPGALARVIAVIEPMVATPLIDPFVVTPVAFLRNADAHLSRAARAAIELAYEPSWAAQARLHANLNTIAA